MPIPTFLASRWCRLRKVSVLARIIRECEEIGRVRRVVVHLPASFPFLPAFRRVALALGAATG